MAQLPKILQPGDSLQDWSRQIQDAFRSIWPKPSPDILPRVGAGGTTYQLLSGPGFIGGSLALPFTVLDATTIASGTPTYQVRVILSSLAGDLPAGFSAGDSPEYILPVDSGDKYIVLGVQTDTTGVPLTSGGRWIDSDSLAPNSGSGSLTDSENDPTTADLDGTFYVALASINVDTTKKVINCANVGFGPVGLNVTKCRDWGNSTLTYNRSAVWTFAGVTNG